MVGPNKATTIPYATKAAKYPIVLVMRFVLPEVDEFPVMLEVEVSMKAPMDDS
jgi:hypothetical protein